MEAAAAGIELIVCITEGIPVAQMVEVKALWRDRFAFYWAKLSGCADAG